MPPPDPPRVKLGRMIIGNSPINSSAACKASSSVQTVAERATSKPILSIACLKISRASPLMIASGLAPII